MCCFKTSVLYYQVFFVLCEFRPYAKSAQALRGSTNIQYTLVIAISGLPCLTLIAVAALCSKSRLAKDTYPFKLLLICNHISLSKLKFSSLAPFSKSTYCVLYTNTRDYVIYALLNLEL